MPSSIPARSQVSSSIATSACARVCVPRSHRHALYFRRGPSDELEELGRLLVVLLVRLGGLERDRRGAEALDEGAARRRRSCCARVRSRCARFARMPARSSRSGRTSRSTR